MKIIQKAILPAVITLAGLTSLDAVALGTAAGTTVTNSASMSYAVNGSTNTVSDSADFLVDVNVDFTVSVSSTAITTASAQTLGDGTSYYVSAGFTVSNTSNVTNTQYQLAVTVPTSAFTLGGSTVTPTAAVTGTPVYKYVTDSDSDNDLTDETPASLSTLIRVNGDDTSAVYYMVVPTANVTAEDEDILGLELTVSASTVSYGAQTDVTVTDDSGVDNNNDTVQFVYANSGDADAANNYDNTELAYFALELSDLPDFGPGPDDNTDTDDGFVKASSVVWDPINGTDQPKAIPGAVVAYTITLRNNGTGAAGVTTITDTITSAMPMGVCAAGVVLTGANGDYTCPSALGITYLDASDVASNAATKSASWTGNTMTATYSEFAAGYSGVVTFYVVID